MVIATVFSLAGRPLQRNSKLSFLMVGLLQSHILKIQDYFIISFKKLKCSWTLTTLQYTLTSQYTCWSDLEVFWLWPESSQIVHARSNFLHPFQLPFSKEGMDHIVQNWPRADLDGLVRVWPNASVWKQTGLQESFGLVSSRTQPARYQFPTFRLGSFLWQKSWIILCKASPDLI